MRVAYYPKTVSVKPTTLILGSFETIHVGHKALIEEAKKHEQQISMMMIEDPSTLPKHSFVLIASLDNRLKQASNFGIDYVSVVKFDNEIKNMNGNDFLENMIEITNANTIIVGSDFGFGKNRELTAKKLKKIFPKTIIVKSVMKNNRKISTTLIRELLELGDVKLAFELMERPYEITKNISYNGYFEFDSSEIIPQSGIYLGYAIINDIKYVSRIHINRKNRGLIKIFNFQNMHKNFLIKIEFLDFVRKIYTDKSDYVKNEDLNEFDKKVEMLYNV